MESKQIGLRIVAPLIIFMSVSLISLNDYFQIRINSIPYLDNLPNFLGALILPTVFFLISVNKKKESKIPLLEPFGSCLVIRNKNFDLENLSRNYIYWITISILMFSIYEIYQFFISVRVFDWMDLIASCIGSTLSIFIFFIIKIINYWSKNVTI